MPLVRLGKKKKAGTAGRIEYRRRIAPPYWEFDHDQEDQQGSHSEEPRHDPKNHPREDERCVITTDRHRSPNHNDMRRLHHYNNNRSQQSQERTRKNLHVLSLDFTDDDDDDNDFTFAQTSNFSNSGRQVVKLPIRRQQQQQSSLIATNEEVPRKISNFSGRASREGDDIGFGTNQYSEPLVVDPYHDNVSKASSKHHPCKAKDKPEANQRIKKSLRTTPKVVKGNDHVDYSRNEGHHHNVYDNGGNDDNTTEEEQDEDDGKDDEEEEHDESEKDVDEDMHVDEQRGHVNVSHESPRQWRTDSHPERSSTPEAANRAFIQDSQTMKRTIGDHPTDHPTTLAPTLPASATTTPSRPSPRMTQVVVVSASPANRSGSSLENPSQPSNYSPNTTIKTSNMTMNTTNQQNIEDGKQIINQPSNTSTLSSSNALTLTQISHQENDDDVRLGEKPQPVSNGKPLSLSTHHHTSPKEEYPSSLASTTRDNGLAMMDYHENEEEDEHNNHHLPTDHHNHMDLWRYCAARLTELTAVVQRMHRDLEQVKIAVSSSSSSSASRMPLFQTPRTRQWRSPPRRRQQQQQVIFDDDEEEEDDDNYEYEDRELESHHVHGGFRSNRNQLLRQGSAQQQQQLMSHYEQYLVPRRHREPLYDDLDRCHYHRLEYFPQKQLFPESGGKDLSKRAGYHLQDEEDNEAVVTEQNNYGLIRRRMDDIPKRRDQSRYPTGYETHPPVKGTPQQSHRSITRLQAHHLHKTPRTSNLSSKEIVYRGMERTGHWGQHYDEFPTHESFGENDDLAVDHYQYRPKKAARLMKTAMSGQLSQHQKRIDVSHDDQQRRSRRELPQAPSASINRHVPTVHEEAPMWNDPLQSLESIPLAGSVEEPLVWSSALESFDEIVEHGSGENSTRDMEVVDASSLPSQPVDPTGDDSQRRRQPPEPRDDRNAGVSSISNNKHNKGDRKYFYLSLQLPAMEQEGGKLHKEDGQAMEQPPKLRAAIRKREQAMQEDRIHLLDDFLDAKDAGKKDVVANLSRDFEPKEKEISIQNGLTTGSRDQYDDERDRQTNSLEPDLSRILGSKQSKGRRARRDLPLSVENRGNTKSDGTRKKHRFSKQNKSTIRGSKEHVTTSISALSRKAAATTRSFREVVPSFDSLVAVGTPRHKMSSSRKRERGGPWS